MSLKEIEAEIRKLDSKERAGLAKWVVESLDELSEAEVEALWVEEAEIRLDELEQGLVTEIPAEEALRRARAASSEKRVTQNRKLKTPGAQTSHHRGGA
jgi:hypothetical protein